jgi:hypothetical protein
MLESSFIEPATPEGGIARTTSTLPWSRPARVAMLLLNALPLGHALAVVAGVFLAHGTLAKCLVCMGGIYIAPPVLVRLLLVFRPLSAGSHGLNTAAFLTWWASAQGQIVFCRFPFLEEILRLVPGLYSAWLRLWGAKIGRLTYWAPGVRVLDRSLLDIGDNVVFGAGVRLNPHVIANDEENVPCLHLGPVRVGHGCRIGGYSLLTAGTSVEPGQTLKAFALSPPFTVWREGRRAKLAIPQ